MRKEQAVQLETAIQRVADKHFLDEIGADNAVCQCAKARFDVMQINTL